MCHPTKAVFKRFSPKIRQVVNISHPHDESAVNRNILRLSRLKNSSFEQAASVAARLGAGTLMWKMDVTSAYKLIAALPQDWHLTGELEWIRGVKHYSFSTTTCFGSSSSADTFHDLGCAAEFIIRLSVANVVICRYADDFIVFIPPLPTGPDHAHAAATRDRIVCVCEALGLPIAKFEGPSSRLVFLGHRHRHDACFRPRATPRFRPRSLARLAHQAVGERSGHSFSRRSTLFPHASG